MTEFCQTLRNAVLGVHEFLLVSACNNRVALVGIADFVSIRTPSKGPVILHPLTACPWFAIGNCSPQERARDEKGSA